MLFVLFLLRFGISSKAIRIHHMGHKDARVGFASCCTVFFSRFMFCYFSTQITRSLVMAMPAIAVVRKHDMEHLLLHPKHGGDGTLQEIQNTLANDGAKRKRRQIREPGVRRSMVIHRCRGTARHRKCTNALLKKDPTRRSRTTQRIHTERKQTKRKPIAGESKWATKLRAAKDRRTSDDTPQEAAG